MNTILRNFIHVLRRFKTSSILNILGLSAAFAVFIVLSIQVHYDFSFDRQFKNSDDIYLLSYYYPERDMHAAWLNQKAVTSIAEKSPLVQAYMSEEEWNMKLYVQTADPATAVTVDYTSVRGNFIDIFTPNVLEGDLAKGIAEGNNIAITEGLAKSFFGEESPMGKTLVNFYTQKPYTIQAVLEDFPKNSSLKNGVYMHLPPQSDSEWSYVSYLKVAPENVKALEEFINSESFFGKEFYQKMQEDPNFKYIQSLVPLKDIHLNYPAKGTGDFNTTISLLAIGILTIVIAFINFINFSLAMAPARIKTLNIQRILGAGKSTQKFIVASESALFSLIAFFLALLLVNFIKGSFINELFTADLALASNFNLIILVGIGCILFGFILGFYPAKYITNFDSLEALNGKGSGSVRSSKLRSFLIVFQFTATIFLLIVTMFIKQQHDYMVDYEWGIQKENIVYLDLEKKKVNFKEFGEELKRDPRIIDYTGSRFYPGAVRMGWGRVWEGKQLNFKSWPVTDNYLDFFGAEVIEGSNFPTINNPDREKLIVNQRFLDKHGLTASDVIGKSFPTFDSTAFIMGVVKDFNFESMKAPIEPMVFVTLNPKYGSQNIISLKLSGNDLKGTIEYIENTWHKFSKEPFDLQFLDENLAKLYRNENNLAKLVGIFSFITILIAIMGVYGLITFNTKYRTKEIALRKVNGADELSIMLLLNKGILVQLLIGFVIAVPLSYFVVNKWLSNFAYHISIHWWVFLLAGLIVLLITLISVSWQSYKAAVVNPSNSLNNE